MEVRILAKPNNQIFIVKWASRLGVDFSAKKVLVRASERSSNKERELIFEFANLFKQFQFLEQANIYGQYA